MNSKILNLEKDMVSPLKEPWTSPNVKLQDAVELLTLQLK